MLLETDTAGAIQTSYTLGGTELISQKKAGAANYFLTDGQGSVRNLTDSSGALVSGQQYNYDAFGKLLSGQSSPASSYLYTGQQFDALTSLYSLRARYYNPGEGRFLSRDIWPVNFNNPIELNRYGYTANNPINHSDPSGNTIAESTLVNSKVASRSTPVLVRVGTKVRDLLSLIRALNYIDKVRRIWQLAKTASNGLPNITVAIAFPLVKGFFIPVVTMYFGGRINPEQAQKALNAVKEEAGTDPRFFKASWQGGNTQHAERLMIYLLQDLHALNLLDDKQEVKGLVGNTPCGPCQVDAVRNGRMYTWQIVSEVTLTLYDISGLY